MLTNQWKTPDVSESVQYPSDFLLMCQGEPDDVENIREKVLI